MASKTRAITTRTILDVLIVVLYCVFLWWILTPDWKRKIQILRLARILKITPTHGQDSHQNLRPEFNPQQLQILDQFKRDLSTFRFPEEV